MQATKPKNMILQFLGLNRVFRLASFVFANNAEQYFERESIVTMLNDIFDNYDIV